MLLGALPARAKRASEKNLVAQLNTLERSYPPQTGQAAANIGAWTADVMARHKISIG